MKVYLQILRAIVKPWVASERPYLDGAPAHTSHLVQNCLFDNVVDAFWFKQFGLPIVVI